MYLRLWPLLFFTFHFFPVARDPTLDATCNLECTNIFLVIFNFASRSQLTCEREREKPINMGVVSIILITFESFTRHLSGERGRIHFMMNIFSIPRTRLAVMTFERE